MARNDNEWGSMTAMTLNLKILKWAIVIFLVGSLAFSTVYIIPAGYRGVLLTFGKPDMDAKMEGIHAKIPFVQKIVKMDGRTQKYEADLTAASRDLQDVKTKIAINYRINANSAPIIYQEIGTDYADKVIFPLEQETNKATTAQFTAEELITKREQVREKMKSLLIEKLAPRGIVVEEISIINFEFSPSFTTAIEQKVTQEQLALAAKNKLEQSKYEAEQRIAQAKGEAEAIKIQVEAIKQQGGKDYVALQAISRWNGQMPVIMGGGVIPFVDINSIMKQEEIKTTSAT